MRKVITKPQTKWNEVKEATIEVRKNNIPLKAFFLYVGRGKPLKVIDEGCIDKLLKGESNSRPISRWGCPKERCSVYYPKKGVIR